MVTTLDTALQAKMRKVCLQKIEQKGDAVGVSFYAFFANKNTHPELLMQAARWWIEEHQLDHFEKAVKIVSMLDSPI